MTDGDGYLSRNKPYLARLQRERRARMVRIDYMPGDNALAILAAKRATVRPGGVDATNSALLDAILREWADLTGINCKEVEKPKSPTKLPGLRHQYARPRMTPATVPGINGHGAQARAGANDSDAIPDRFLRLAGPTKPKAAQRVPCGARRHRDGQPCQALSEPGKRRCRFHGGRSTGPKTDAGKARALANLRQYRKPQPAHDGGKNGGMES